MEVAVLALAVLTELVPDAHARGGRVAAAGGTACGALVMLLLAAVLGVEGT